MHTIVREYGTEREEKMLGSVGGSGGRGSSVGRYVGSVLVCCVVSVRFCDSTCFQVRYSVFCGGWLRCA